MPLLDAVKLSLPLSTNAFDGILTDLIAAAKADLALVGIKTADDTDPLIKRAVITYCRCHFGSPEDYNKLKASYDEQKAQLMMSRRYKAANNG